MMHCCSPLWVCYTTKYHKNPLLADRDPDNFRVRPSFDVFGQRAIAPLLIELRAHV